MQFLGFAGTTSAVSGEDTLFLGQMCFVGARASLRNYLSRGGDNRMSTLDIYHVSPVWLQNLAVTAKGWSLARKRYKNSNDLVREYMLELSASEAEVLTEQTRRLRELLEEAYHEVPYYRQVLEPWKNRLGSMSLDDFTELPILEKSVLRSRVAEFQNMSRIRRFGSTRVQTSGTTGTPISFDYDWESVRHNFALR